MPNWRPSHPGDGDGYIYRFVARGGVRVGLPRLTPILNLLALQDELTGEVVCTREMGGPRKRLSVEMAGFPTREDAHLRVPPWIRRPYRLPAP